MYEPRTTPPIPLLRFIRRLMTHVGLVAAIVGVSLFAGMIGYVSLAHMTWVDAFLNAAMLLGGMGEMGDLPTSASKIFAGLYSLYAGLVFIVSASVLMAPIVHRILHKLHADKK
jgi:hypothetical protein